METLDEKEINRDVFHPHKQFDDFFSLIPFSLSTGAAAALTWAGGGEQPEQPQSKPWPHPEKSWVTTPRAPLNAHWQARVRIESPSGIHTVARFWLSRCLFRLPQTLGYSCLGEFQLWKSLPSLFPCISPPPLYGIHSPTTLNRN